VWPYTGDQPTQHFALIKRGNKTYAVPVDWFYVFKPARKAQVSSEQALALQTAEREREAKLTKSFNKRFNIKDEASASLRMPYLACLLIVTGRPAPSVSARCTRSQSLFLSL
jgi:hypothetical protein